MNRVCSVRASVIPIRSRTCDPALGDAVRADPHRTNTTRLTVARWKLEIEAGKEPDVRHAPGRGLHFKEHSALLPHPHNEVHAAIEIRIAEVEAVALVVIIYGGSRRAGAHAIDVTNVVGLKSAMAQAKIRSCAHIRDPNRITAKSWNGIEDVEVDPEKSRHFPDTQFYAWPERDIRREEWTEGPVQAYVEDLWIEADPALNAHAKPSGRTLDVSFGLLHCRRHVLLSSRDGCRRDARRPLSGRQGWK
jgi:hypothetical protein